MSRRERTLPIRRWLVLALGAMFLMPALAGAVVFASYEFDAAGEVAREISADVARWSDPTWQAEARATYTARGVNFVLFDARGREVYRSTPDPLAPHHDRRFDLSVRRVTVPAGTGASGQSQPAGTAYLYFLSGPPERIWVVPLAGLTTLALTSAVVAWFLDRSVLKPLAATSRAADRVAVGDLHVVLPGSPVREVAQVNSAFTRMSAALSASLHQQSGLEQERRLFLSAIVHDLRTPLFSLRGYLEGMETGVADTPEKRTYYLAVAKEKANALERLIADLFEYTRLEYLDLVPTREPLDLGALLRHTAEGMRPQAETKAVELALDGSPEPMEIEGDGHLLTRAVENLLDNALRHTPAGGVIRLGWHREAQKAVFSVSDTGPGIAPEDLPHLFAALYRGEGSRNRRTGGAGLGLTIAQRILIAHGGDLTAANQPSGGACFTASIPSSGTVTDVTRSNGATAAPSRAQERAPSG